MSDEGGLEHGAVHAPGVEAQVGQAVLGPKVEQGRQIADAGFEIDEGAAAVVAGKDGGEVDGQSARAAAAGGAQDANEPAGRLGDRVLAPVQAGQDGVQLGLQIGFVEIVVGPLVQGPQDEPGVGGLSDGEDGAEHAAADLAEQAESLVGRRREDDGEHVYAAPPQHLLRAVERNQAGVAPHLRLQGVLERAAAGMRRMVDQHHGMHRTSSEAPPCVARFPGGCDPTRAYLAVPRTAWRMAPSGTRSFLKGALACRLLAVACPANRARRDAAGLQLAGSWAQAGGRRRAGRSPALWCEQRPRLPPASPFECARTLSTS